MKVNEPPVVVEETFQRDALAVWQAITDVKQMTQWFFENIPDFKAEVGFSTEFVVENEGRVFPHCWTVSEVVPQQRLEYNWKYRNYEGDAYVLFELFPQNDGTMLRVSLRVTEDFPDNIPEFRKESCLSGWQYFICERLKAFLSENKNNL